ncbi:MAG: phage/plasmid primase, P4 family [Planctomycetota bacterium]|jgi:putative DNA primase/helicase
MTSTEQLDTWQKLSETVSVIPLVGKAPFEKNWQKWCTQKRKFSPADFANHNAGITGGPASNRLIIDVDCPGLFGITCLRKGWQVPETYTVKTGTGKPHYHLTYPQNGWEYGNKGLKNKYGFDLRGLGGQVVAPGSIHPDTGKPYVIDKDLPVAPPPQWLLGLYEDPIDHKQPQGGAWNGSIDDLPIKTTTKALIKDGVPKPQRSEAIMTVCNALVWSNLTDPEIVSIFDSYPIGEKYRKKGRAKVKWLQAEIGRARSYTTDRAEQRPRVATARKTDLAVEIYNFTDVGNAERFAHEWKDEVRYCHTSGKWHLYDPDTGTWRSDLIDRVRQLAKKTVREMYAEASKIKDKDRRTKTAEHALKCESKAKMDAFLALAQSEPEIPVTNDHFDKDPWLFNCLNGTLDLKTGKLKPHDKTYLITKLAPVKYIEDAECPLWLSFLDKVMDHNEHLISFIQSAIGYSMTGDIREQCILFLYGIGSNGKSTFLETMRHVMGDYAQQTDFKTFLIDKCDSIRNDLARLKGARFVSAAEVDSGKRFAEVLVKQVTGGDTITARFLHREFFEFRPEFKIWLAANHKPQIWGTDIAIWRRIRLIPFNVIIPEEQQDHELPDKLKKELPGILAWAVQGCLDWQEKGLGVPDEVRNATMEYKDEMDILAPFISECCVLNPRAESAASELYQTYCDWCDQNGETAIKQRTFGIRLSERGLAKSRTGRKRKWVGIGLTDPENSDACDACDANSTFFPKKTPRVKEKGKIGSQSVTSVTPCEKSGEKLPDGVPEELKDRIDPDLAWQLYTS